MKTLLLSLLLACCLCSASATTPVPVPPAQPSLTQRPAALQTFIDQMVKEYHFKKAPLEALFNQIQANQTVIDLMNKPYEAKPWYEYQKLFVSPSHITNGVIFWHKYHAVLEDVSKQTGVPPQIIVAIIGVESRYGTQKGNYPALATLYTFAFYYPRRADFFRSELKHFLLLSREQNWDPLTIKGSYAAALGQPQFMPSSYRTFAKAYAKTNRVNLFDFEPDVIASIANYFMMNGWQRGEPVATPAMVDENQLQQIPVIDRTTKMSKPKMTLQEYRRYGIMAQQNYPLTQPALLLRYDLQQGNEYWFGFQNLYVITRYNSSILYAMAVYQLSNKLQTAYQQQYGTL